MEGRIIIKAAISWCRSDRKNVKKSNHNCRYRPSSFNEVVHTTTFLLHTPSLLLYALAITMY